MHITKWTTGFCQDPGLVNVMSRDTVFRVLGVPALVTITQLKITFSKEFGEDSAIDLKKSTLCPSCFGDDTQVALIQFIAEPPRTLSTLQAGHPYEMELEGDDITVDKDFYGLTQLYPTSGAVVADVVAVCGLNGHAYGSWRGRGNLRRMWLRHFFSQDIPNYRTMTYGYNSCLTARAVHTTQDYSKGLLEELIKARNTDQEKKRPLVFIGHSFGGVIIVQSLVRARESDLGTEQNRIFSATHLTIFFGTPHRGFVVDDIRASLEEGSSRHSLLDSIEKGASILASELSRFIDYSDNIKIVNFFETHQTRKLARGADGKLSRSGDFFTAVERESSVLQLPRKLTESLPVDADNSEMVKFASKKSSQSYTSILKHIREFVAHYDLTTTGASDRFHTAYAAVLGKDVEALRRLLRSRPEAVNDKKRGTTLLHLAIEDGGDLEVITTLLEHQASLDSVDCKGITPLYLAASKGYTEIVEILAKNGADINAICERKVALHVATLGSHKDVVSKLCSYKADTAAVVDDQYGFTALHLAARTGNTEIVSMLLLGGAKIDARGKDEDTPLHCAAWNGHVKVIELLINHSADVTARGIKGDTALHFAVFQGHVAAVGVLIDYGLDIHAKNNDGHTVLHIAADAGLVEAARCLLLLGANPRAVDNNQNIALHFAAQNGHDQVVRLLLEGDGFDTTSSRDINGYTALHTAAWGDHLRVVQILLEYGADVEAVEWVSGYTLYTLATLGKHREVQVLLSRRTPGPSTSRGE